MNILKLVLTPKSWLGASSSILVHWSAGDFMIDLTLHCMLLSAQADVLAVGVLWCPEVVGSKKIQVEDKINIP